MNKLKKQIKENKEEKFTTSTMIFKKELQAPAS